jgi:hypothetical protein
MVGNVGIGYCPCCGDQIFEITKEGLGRPLGNYRSIKFMLKNGKNMIVPFCMECHEHFNDAMMEQFVQKLYEYLKNCAPESWAEKKKIDYAKKYSDLPIIGFKKQGVLPKKDLEKGQVVQ